MAIRAHQTTELPEVVELRARVAAVEQENSKLWRAVRALQASLGPRDAADAAVPAAIAHVFGAAPFTAQHAIDRAKLDPELWRVLQDADVTDPRELGALFKRLKGVPVGDYRIKLARKSSKGHRWQVGLVGHETDA